MLKKTNTSKKRRMNVVCTRNNFTENPGSNENINTRNVYTNKNSKENYIYIYI